MFTAVGQMDFRAKRPGFNSTHLARLIREGEYSKPLLLHYKKHDHCDKHCRDLNGSCATTDFQQKSQLICHTALNTCHLLVNH